MIDVYLLLGSNMGQREWLLKQAADLLLEANAGELLARSGVYQSEPWGFAHDTPFLNQLLLLRTDMEPFTLLDLTQRIERQLGRSAKTTVAYEARLIDIDLLFYGQEVLQSQRLTLPHPQTHLRRFALLPLVELSPQWIHPTLGRSMEQLLAHCPDTGVVQLLR